MTTIDYGNINKFADIRSMNDFYRRLGISKSDNINCIFMNRFDAYCLCDFLYENYRPLCQMEEYLRHRAAFLHWAGHCPIIHKRLPPGKLHLCKDAEK